MAIYSGYYYKASPRLTESLQYLERVIAPQAHTRGTSIETMGNAAAALECYCMQYNSGGAQSDFDVYGTTVYNSGQILGDLQTANTAPYPAGTWTPYNAPYLVYLELGRASELPELYPYSAPYVDMLARNTTLTDPHVYTTKTYASMDDLARSNAVFVKSIRVYDNSHDGEYSYANKRDLLPRSCDVIVWGRTTARVIYLPNGNTILQMGGNYGVSLRQFAKIAQTLPAPFDPVSTDDNAPVARGSALAAGISDEFTVKHLYIRESGEIRYRGELALWPNLAALQRDLNAFGCPYTFSLDDAESTNVDDLPDYAPDGVEDNPEGGGGGDGDNTSDPIEFPDPQDLVLPSSMGYNLIAMTGPELQALTDVLWRPVEKSIASALNVYFNSQNLTDALVSIRYYPFDIEQHDPSDVASSDVLRVAWSDDTFSGGIILDGYDRAIDAGYYDLREYYGTFLDYSPHTSVDIWLPYIGYKSLPVDLIQNKRLSVKYFVDFVDGLGTAVIWADDDPIALYTGALGIDLAITGQDAAAKSRQVVDNIAGAVAGVARIGTGSIMLASGGGVFGGLADIASGAGQAAQNVGAALMQEAPTVHYGTSGGENWLLLPQQVHLRITRAVSATPAKYIDEIGYPSTYTAPASSFTGYLACKSVTGSYEDIPEPEVREIERLLADGIIIKRWD